ncbi:hypothetical protein Cni_G29154 [Canna indica]|uniref:Uncharacterized protein n=1 Tax=Canna indica TaxID=4628 RepID=A0AAQ3L4N1_9LILI|nr:hypothetical protein Cni_G29154 [Canna indica]
MIESRFKSDNSILNPKPKKHLGLCDNRLEEEEIIAGSSKSNEERLIEADEEKKRGKGLLPQMKKTTGDAQRSCLGRSQRFKRMREEKCCDKVGHNEGNCPLRRSMVQGGKTDMIVETEDKYLGPWIQVQRRKRSNFRMENKKSSELSNSFQVLNNPTFEYFKVSKGGAGKVETMVIDKKEITKKEHREE